MKKLLLTLSVLFISINSFSQSYYYQSYQFAFKFINEYGYWTDWSDWEESDLLISIDLDNDLIQINSKYPQIYKITKFIKSFTDNSGGKQLEYEFTSHDGLKGILRLRIESNGNSQIYIDYSDVMLVYNVLKI